MKKTYITTSIAYVNAEPHIGFLYELLAGDVLKRYYQARGKEVFLLTGTDEHGIKVAQAATASGKEPQEFVDEISKKFEQLGKDFNINFDYFIRTTNPEHKNFVQERWQQLEKAGVLKKKKYSGLYCSGCEAFKTEGEIDSGRCSI
ncbi:MAG: class I tRNA ligase family protein, partial [Candidatus Berkelbacteria bacterium]|nr:class I tRNA ligase family protein [Candidatus Berkelbacteria bacterium]